MKIGIFGTGNVGQTLAKKLLELGHDVIIGARSADSPSLGSLPQIDGLETGSFADAAAFGELLINATNGNVSLEAIGGSAAADRQGKTLIELANCLEPQPAGMPQSIASAKNSLAAQIQQAFPELNVVKALNTMTVGVMVEPSLVSGDHVVFVSGDDDDAKQEVKALLAEIGWREVQIVDLGGIATAIGPEMMMQIWLNVIAARGGFAAAGPLNFAINLGA